MRFSCASEARLRGFLRGYLQQRLRPKRNARRLVLSCFIKKEPAAKLRAREYFPCMHHVAFYARAHPVRGLLFLLTGLWPCWLGLDFVRGSSSEAKILIILEPKKYYIGAP